MKDSISSPVLEDGALGATKNSFKEVVKGSPNKRGEDVDMVGVYRGKT